ncbi:translation initiation factor IF-2 [Candidatus Giovannonibacteria bacterium RIFCSPLOWO2_02_FULL_45_14]|uniref:Translation initiation factor IF-2 n=1 Tax=Candidatus Giovannonibacteria bacterium RIFCSPLOWO2_12_FULL_44_15 TaxID=1798364 RepID=A0A1F5XZJ4_9BACT|nr:MAG: translation initiation factor IF-2 [Candidatus Giovannonibacteria bacterium RIFCSPHIGHO2_02_FULL_44_31]OGF75966.1 MAG: translation initiation factor IF-2 [Candidatus Giovannonibacteria bacterium RIFCSPHIGHO2_12_FULL_44_29]OGF90591.1 MAG: translation initiation factor IF-2 [Candidatus Giovannonibacteria bacterium RIFCSPLOWO2_02_FULL_45_14]OGF93334.1 MAG: translation initiation factor IF-2 [Candidatus Giovannonibacteria bacterium RIFCSPLOWO2_12_FULL_44_15]
MAEQIKTKRPPVVVVMGHIDHGKTSILDKIREANVAGKETGGITQHIGAYKAHNVTFLDTPGHEAFSKMRGRGAKVADIALLVVAADDGVKPQTEEALKAIEEAKLPFIVVLNKIDKENADIERAKKELGEKGIIFEEWGGKVPLAKVSAKTGEGIKELLDLILLLSDVEDLSSNLSQNATGVVIESHLDSKRGQAATLLVRDGKFKKGDWILAGDTSVKTKILEDENGKAAEEVSASDPVRVVGFNGPVKVGSTFESFDSKDKFNAALEASAQNETAKSKLSMPEGNKTIPLVIKADAAGSIEAIQSQISKLDLKDFSLVTLRAEVGNITEDDIKLASANKNSVVVSFRVKIDRAASILSERFRVRAMNFNLIYELEDWLRRELENIIGEEKIRKTLGISRILKIFKEDGSKKIVGGVVESGGIYLQKHFVLIRRNFHLGEGKILELQTGKIKTKEILVGGEFGALIEIGLEVAPGDQLEIYDEEIVKRKL